MAPFTHHQRPCLLGSPTRVVIQHHLQLSLLQHRTDGFDVYLSLRPCRQVPPMKYLSRWRQTHPDVVLKSAKTSWTDRVFELFESIFLTVCMCRSMKPLERGYPGDEVVCLMPKPERNLANSLLWNGGLLSDTILSGYPSIEKRLIRRSLNDQNDVLAL